MKIENLEDVIRYIKQHHSAIRKTTGPGVWGMKFLRDYNGKRTLIEDFSGFKIVDFNVYGVNSICIQQVAMGITFKGNVKQTVSSRLWLPELIAIYIYNNSAQFYSCKSIDFAYTIDSMESSVENMVDFIYNKQGDLKAHWTSPCDNTDELIDRIVKGVNKNSKNRFIDMD